MASKIAACLSTGNDNWETPDALFRDYDRIYNFVLDAAANEVNHKCGEWFGPGGVCEDALSEDAPWEEALSLGNIWLNPPYSRGLQEKFVRRALQAARAVIDTGHRIVCLLPSRTDTKLFHNVIQPWGDVEFLRGRVRFVGAPASAPFPSMVVVF